jgi:hypothetical protein
MNSAIVVSKRVMEFLQSKKLPGVEYLPVPIVNHKGRIASPDYFIVNILAIQDCLDLKQSMPMYNHINKTEIDEVKQMVLDEKKIDSSFPLFRLKNYFPPVLVEAGLAEEIKAQNFSGLKFLTLKEFEA